MKKLTKMMVAMVMVFALVVPTFAMTQDQYLDTLSTLELYAMTYNLGTCTAVMEADPTALSSPASVLVMKSMTGQTLSKAEALALEAITLFSDQVSADELGTIAWAYGPSGTYTDTAVDYVFTSYNGCIFIEATAFIQVGDECYLVNLPYGLSDTEFVLLKDAITCKKV